MILHVFFVAVCLLAFHWLVVVVTSDLVFFIKVESHKIAVVFMEGLASLFILWFLAYLFLEGAEC